MEDIGVINRHFGENPNRIFVVLGLVGVVFLGAALTIGGVFGGGDPPSYYVGDCTVEFQTTNKQTNQSVQVDAVIDVYSRDDWELLESGVLADGETTFETTEPSMYFVRSVDSDLAFPNATGEIKAGENVVLLDWIPSEDEFSADPSWRADSGSSWAAGGPSGTEFDVQLNFSAESAEGNIYPIEVGRSFYVPEEHRDNSSVAYSGMWLVLGCGIVHASISGYAVTENYFNGSHSFVLLNPFVGYANGRVLTLECDENPSSGQIIVGQWGDNPIETLW